MLKTLLVCLSLLFAMQEVSADVIEQTASMPTTFEHDSNPTLANTNKRPVNRIIATPRYKIISSDGVKEMSADLALSIERSSDQRARLDREDPSMALAWKTDLPRGLLKLGASYYQTSILTSELAENGLIQSEGSRRNQNFNAEYTHFLTDRLSMSLNAGYSHVRYSGGEQVNYQLPSASATFNYQYNEVFTPFIQAAASRYQPDSNQPDTDYLSMTAGGTWQLSNRLDLTFNAGLNNIRAAQTDRGFQGEFRLKHVYERFVTTAGLARAISPSGTGGFIESDTLQAGIAYDLTNRSGIGSDFSARRNYGTNKSEYDQLNLFYRYEVTPEWDMRVNTQFRYRKDAADQTTNAKLLGLTLNYVHPKF